MISNLIAQWEEQSCIALILPHKKTHWIEYLDEVLESYYKLAILLAQYQKVLIITQDINVAKPLINKQNIDIIEAHYNDTWARDILPMSIRKNNKILLLNFIFNGWGNKYRSQLDNKLSASLFEDMIDIDICLEGGAIDNNGDNLILLNKQSFTYNRNEDSFENIKKELEDILKANILVLEQGSLMGDDTNSHIDTLARFVNKNTIVYLSCDDKENPNFHSLLEMEKELEQIATINNLNLIPILAPSQKYYNNEPLPATYINFIIINNAIIMPTYNDKNDKLAISIIKQYFPKREIIGFDASMFIRQNGSLHCASMNFFRDSL